jgi:hypothetical protein
MLQRARSSAAECKEGWEEQLDSQETGFEYSPNCNAWWQGKEEYPFAVEGPHLFE